MIPDSQNSLNQLMQFLANEPLSIFDQNIFPSEAAKKESRPKDSDINQLALLAIGIGSSGDWSSHLHLRAP